MFRSSVFCSCLTSAAHLGSLSFLDQYKCEDEEVAARLGSAKEATWRKKKTKEKAMEKAMEKEKKKKKKQPPAPAMSGWTEIYEWCRFLSPLASKNNTDT
uniref:Uncharacterized protein n=1 Tax=Caenorhabditis japonica TaxID=281687 RepID=A0A8R1EBY3_CAEJA